LFGSSIYRRLLIAREKVAKATSIAEDGSGTGANDVKFIVLLDPEGVSWKYNVPVGALGLPAALKRLKSPDVEMAGVPHG
jgi:hypothetical protein